MSSSSWRGWSVQFSQREKKSYWFNSQTGESLWTPPALSPWVPATHVYGLVLLDPKAAPENDKWSPTKGLLCPHALLAVRSSDLCLSLPGGPVPETEGADVGAWLDGKVRECAGQRSSGKYSFARVPEAAVVELWRLGTVEVRVLRVPVDCGHLAGAGGGGAGEGSEWRPPLGPASLGSPYAGSAWLPISPNAKDMPRNALEHRALEQGPEQAPFLLYALLGRLCPNFSFNDPPEPLARAARELMRVG